MNPSSDPLTSPTQTTKKPSLYPPEPPHNPSIARPFSKPSFESMTSTLQPTLSEQDAASPPPHRPQLSSEYSSNHPFSAFYSHPTTRTSLDQAKSASKLNVQVHEHDDLESQSRITTTTTTRSQHPHPPPPEYNNNNNNINDGDEKKKKKNQKPGAGAGAKRISTMWPSIPRCAAHLSSLQQGSSSSRSSPRRRHNITGTVRGSRACAPYQRLSRRQKWVVQILLAVVVVGAATALGVGISKAVGAGVW